MSEVSFTTRWAAEHEYRVHPALRQAIDNARLRLGPDQWALAVAEAFDAGVALGAQNPADLEPNVRALVEALEAAAAAMDDLNGDTGTKSRPCSFCRASSYNAEVGIEHAANCPILQARAALEPFGEVG